MSEEVYKLCDKCGGTYETDYIERLKLRLLCIHCEGERKKEKLKNPEGLD